MLALHEKRHDRTSKELTMDIGTVCMKIAGRDAGQYCVILKHLENSFVLIDGNTRRRRCNLNHLEPLGKILDIQEDASTGEVKQAMKNAGIPVLEKAKKKTHLAEKSKPIKKRGTKAAVTT